METYIKKIRSKLGHNKFIHPAARIIIENEKEEILLIQKLDSGQWGIPAGAFEENETIEECIKREVKEETGLRLLEVEVIGISSNPLRESVSYPNGDQIQYFTIEFYATTFVGEIHPVDTQEIKQASFVAKTKIPHLPANEESVFESLEYFRKTGKPMLK
ncbi:MAG: NUDIX domain-containing protein [Bacteroidia bacterium]|nr:NUDIX domain-containing protein [Bacteroidia bacterium]